MGFKSIIICIIFIIVALLVINYIFQPASLAGTRNSLRDFFGKFIYEEKIKTETTCAEFDIAQDMGMNVMGVNAKEVMRFDCTNFCNQVNLDYASMGCLEGYINCYCK